VGKPIRRKKIFQVTDDIRTGQERILETTDECDSLSKAGSIDTVGRVKKFFMDCGCDGPPGGRCHEDGCGAIVCQTCFGHCAGCQKPLCLEHSWFVESPDRGRIRLCRHCRDKLVRKERWGKIARFLLSPFVRFEE